MWKRRDACTQKIVKLSGFLLQLRSLRRLVRGIAAHHDRPSSVGMAPISDTSLAAKGQNLGRWVWRSDYHLATVNAPEVDC